MRMPRSEVQHSWVLICRSYAAVFDGHNGAKAAELCAQQMHQVLAADGVFRAAPDQLRSIAVWPGLTRLRF